MLTKNNSRLLLAYDFLCESLRIIKLLHICFNSEYSQIKIVFFNTIASVNLIILLLVFMVINM